MQQFFFAQSVDANAKQLSLKRRQLAELDKTIDKLESRLMKDEIGHETYKKWHRKYNLERGELLGQINNLQQDNNNQFKKLKDYLPLLSDVPGIFKNVNLEKKHLLLKLVFDHGLIYSEGLVRTPKINIMFYENSLILKENDCSL